ncbi:MAG: hypothetical protein EHM61_14995 [Acidobacteria bacterium]|nr:MAG: hypothetical protein EHM61_14995 [Acidobacteriota bacterium]
MPARDIKRMPFLSALSQYRKQAEGLLEGWRSGDPETIRVFHEKHSPYHGARQALVKAQRTLAAVDQLPLQMEPANRATVLAAAQVKAHHRISYADAFAVVTAQEHEGCARDLRSGV